MARMGHPMETHPSPIQHNMQFEILQLRKKTYSIQIQTDTQQGDQIEAVLFRLLYNPSSIQLRIPTRLFSSWRLRTMYA